MTNNKTIKGNAPYFTKLIGFKNDEAFGKAIDALSSAKVINK